MEHMEQNELPEVQQTEELTETPETSEETKQPAEEAETPEKESGFKIKDLLEIVETMLVSVFVVLLVFTYLLRPVTVIGGSMNPTLEENDKLLMYRLMYQPQVGDIVVVDNKEGHVLDGDEVVASGFSLNQNIIKRVIAVGGQTVEVDAANGIVRVDGVALEEDYIKEPTLSDDGAFRYPITVPEGFVFVMGDNRNHSTDSRSATVGLVPEEDVLGAAFFRYLPFEDFGFVG